MALGGIHPFATGKPAEVYRQCLLPIRGEVAARIKPEIPLSLPWY